jgi:hypothetical protein
VGWSAEIDTTGPAPPDADGDGIPDSIDNCPASANANQADADHDGIGDVCDSAPNGPGSGPGTGGGGGQTGAKKLVVTVKRKRNPNHHRSCFKVMVTSSGAPVPDATVNLAGKVRTTKANGVTRICRRGLPHARRLPISVTADGYTALQKKVTIRQRRRR